EQEVWYRKQQILLPLQPQLGRAVLTEWAMAIAAGMIAIAQRATVGTGVEVSTQSRRATLGDGFQHSLVAGQHVLAVVRAVRRSVLAHNICHGTHSRPGSKTASHSS